MADRSRVRQLTVSLDASDGRVGVRLLHAGKKVGELNAYEVDTEAITRRCLDALTKLEARVGFPLRPYVVYYSKLPPRLRGTGIGTAMYLSAAEGAAMLGGALVQHACFKEPGARGSTSALARNVWRGRRFRGRLIHGDGVVAYMPSEAWGAGASMLGFDQLELDPGALINPAVSLGASLARALQSPAAYSILDAHPQLQGSTWTSGSCMVLAVALKRWFRPFRYAGVARGDTVIHVLVSCGGTYIDGDGSSTRSQLRNRWRKSGHSRARVVWLDTPIVGKAKQPGTGEQIACPPRAVDDVYAFLTAAIGSPRDWGLFSGVPC